MSVPSCLPESLTSVMVRRKTRERGDGIHPPLGLYMVMDLPPDVEQCVKPHKASSAAQIGLRPQGINNVMIKSDIRSLEVSGLYRRSPLPSLLVLPKCLKEGL